MKRKILLVLLLICPLFINACSCDKFDLNTYTSAVKHYNDSTGLDYKLTITTVVEGEDKYYFEESTNKYELSTTKKVENFSSKYKKYVVQTDDKNGNSAPKKITELNRYYKSEENRFYTNVIEPNVNHKQVENITYEEKYSDNDGSHVNNLIPIFEEKFISNFNIIKDSANKGSSIATFTAACPALVECKDDVTTYTVHINKNYYFSKIEFVALSIVKKSVLNENNIEEVKDFIKTTTYKYEFNGYNSNIFIDFPGDLDSY